MESSPTIIRNKVVLATRPAAQAFIAQRWTTRKLAAGEVLYDAGESFTHAVFPHFGVLSLVDEERGVEKASIGNEGFVGFTYVLGGTAVPNRTVCVVPGHASWLALDDLNEAIAQFECVRDIMLRYARALIVQVMESVGCNSLHSADQRVAKWLLHASDRTGGEPFPVTQESIAGVLALRRATVSEACSRLLRAGAISYSRGVVSNVNHDVLSEYTCSCYGRTVAAAIQ